VGEPLETFLLGESERSIILWRCFVALAVLALECPHLGGGAGLGDLGTCGVMARVGCCCDSSLLHVTHGMAWKCENRATLPTLACGGWCLARAVGHRQDCSASPPSPAWRHL